MELNPIKASHELAWWGLRKTGLTKVANMAINCCNQSRHVGDLRQSKTEHLKQREALILQGAGELELQVQKGLVVLDEDTRIRLWTAVKSGQTGVHFSDVFDGHVAELLELTTPGGPEAISE